MKIKKPLITRIVGNGLKPFPTLIVIVFLFAETGYAADGPLKLRPALQFSKMGIGAIKGTQLSPIRDIASLTEQLKHKAAALQLPFNERTPIFLWVGTHLGGGAVSMFNRALQAEGPEAFGGGQAVFLPLEIPEDEFMAAMPIILKHPQVRAVNITTPYKMQLIKQVDKLGIAADPVIRQVGVISTIHKQDGSWVARILDGASWVEFYESIQPQRPLKVAHVVLFGAGGAGREILAAMASKHQEPSSITVVEPDEAARIRAVALLKALLPRSEASVVTNEEQANIQLRNADILINATPLGKLDERSPLEDASRIRKDAAVFDLNWWREGMTHNDGLTPFLAKAKERGAKIFNGMRMAVTLNARFVAMWLGHERDKGVHGRIAQRMYGETLANGFSEADASLFTVNTVISTQDTQLELTMGFDTKASRSCL